MREVIGKYNIDKVLGQYEAFDFPKNFYFDFKHIKIPCQNSALPHKSCALGYETTINKGTLKSKNTKSVVRFYFTTLFYT